MCLGNSNLSGAPMQSPMHVCCAPRHPACSFACSFARRCSTPIWLQVPKSPEDLPVWNYDGSSTGQAPGDDSEVYLVPR